MGARKYTLRGLVVGGLIVLIGCLALVAGAYRDYDGNCITLGLFGLSSGTTYECSFSEYVSRDPRSFTFLLPYLFWWVPVLMLLLPVVTGWWIDRRKIVQGVSSLKDRPMGKVLGTMSLFAMAIAPVMVALIALSPLPRWMAEVFYESAPEGMLIRIADGDDPAASYAALEELLRRALDESLSDSGFGSLVTRGLERQADPELAWRGYYGALLQVAYSQGRLSEADLRRYASHFLGLRIDAKYDNMSSWPEEGRPPPVRLEVVGDHRGGALQEVDGKPVLPMFAMVHVKGITLDEAPVAMLDIPDTPQFEIVLYHQATSASTIGRNISLATGDSLVPGRHVLTGRVEIVVKQGVHSWRDGADEEAPVIVSYEDQFRVTFDVPSP